MKKLLRKLSSNKSGETILSNNIKDSGLSVVKKTTKEDTKSESIWVDGSFNTSSQGCSSWKDGTFDCSNIITDPYTNQCGCTSVKHDNIYLAERIEKNQSYSEYLAERIEKNQSYTEYLAEIIRIMDNFYDDIFKGEEKNK